MNQKNLRRRLRLPIGEAAAKCLAKNKLESFEFLGRAYVKMALKEPNLFKFLYLGENPMGKPYNLKDIGRVRNREMINKISEQTGLTEEQVIRFVRNTVVYSHGIATMLATGMLKGTEKEMMDLINNAADAFMLREGVDPAMFENKEK